MAERSIAATSFAKNADRLKKTIHAGLEPTMPMEEVRCSTHEPTVYIYRDHKIIKAF